jgi:FlaA1/EpsC-like NDP-sugar epimerase
MPAKLKLLLLLVADAVVICTGQIATLLLLNQWYQNPLTPTVSTLAFILVSWLNGFYKTSISHVGIGAVKQALVAVAVSGLSIFLLDESARLTLFSSVLALTGVIGYRVFAREVLFQQRHSTAARTLVYGAGSAGVQFVTASMQGDTHNVVGYIDDDPALCDTSIHGRNVYPSKNIEALVRKYKVQIIVLALPSVSKAERKRIIESLIPLPVRVVTVPTYEDLIEGKQRITQTEDISIEDLLGRDPVPPLDQYMKARTTDKVCLVTGAGGSIGSELCRQIVKCKPKHLVLLDVSEPALFAIEQELLRNNFTKLTCCLGSVTNPDFIARVFNDHNIDCVYHAAAYKHVPMVEANPLAGLINNVEGTQNVLNAALSHRCESFTLISTDKAVRPTNVMGATKRLAEMACQLAAESNTGPTVISMVRFGNVLGSSGSVIPTFQQQIKRGGPVTLTHPEITRYFMTIPEAAQLVIQAAGMAESGDLFLLDMGTPVKIIDLAERLIRLSGKSVKRDTNNETMGEIEIKVTGLRPGEKLYEELLVDADAQPTAHAKIMRAREQYVSLEALEVGMQDLISHLNQSNTMQFKLTLAELVVGYKPSEPTQGV